MGWVALPSKKKFSLLGPPFITQIRVVFLYLNAKTKKLYIYGCADLCAFSKGQNPFWLLGAKVEARSLIRNKAHLLRGGGEGGSAREVGSSGLLNTHYHLRVSLPCLPFWTRVG